MDELLADFLAETTENLAALDEALLKLERAPEDSVALGVVFRLFHTIKGTCGFLDFPRLEKLAHTAEDLLERLRSRDGPQTLTLLPPVLAAIDRIKDIVDATAISGAEPAGDDTALLAAMAGGSVKCAWGGRAAVALQPNPSEAPPEAQSIRVNITTIETLMTLVSELVLTRNQLLQIVRTDPDSRFNTPLQRLSHLTSDLQEGIMKTRMQPIRHAWTLLPRMVRDLAAELGKQITLETQGGDTELDRHVIELIRAPLTQMVRNCADHGIEACASRIAVGKPASGTIRLNSFHEGGTIVVEIGDDGAGLNTDRIRERAVARRVINPADLADMGERQLNRLIFTPGLSTAASVTAVSGRGVGMDIVQTNVERLGGTIEVSTAPGLGTMFTVRIPLTLAIISALTVEAGGQCFALPQGCIAEVLRVDTGAAATVQEPSVEYVDGTPMLRLRERLLPLVSLAAMLGLRVSQRSHVMTPGHAVTIVVAQLGGLLAGLLVERVFDTEEIVVKPASRLLRHIALFSGSTILGDGSVIMILDPSGLSRTIGQDGGAKRHQQPAVPATTETENTRSAMLLVRLTAGARPVAVLLGLVARIESIAHDAIQTTQDHVMTPYRGFLMPLVTPAGRHPEIDPMPVLVFSERGRSVGLVVAEIVDVVEETLTLELASERPGVLGTAMISGQATEVLDTAYWLIRGRRDWFADDRVEAGTATRLLVVEESKVFRQLHVTALAASGYHVTAVESAAKALALRDADAPAFAATLSDVETETGPAIEAGFDEYVGKFDRAALLAALQRRLAPAERHPA